MAILYLVATPIGNLGDMTPRAVEILKNADLIACEDTRTSAPLLRTFNVSTPLVSCHKFNEAERARELSARFLEPDFQMALITDAGTPCISDPGGFLVRAARESGAEIVAAVGASALAAAISASGMDADEWTFCGFFPREKKEQNALLERLIKGGGTCKTAYVFYESPLRIEKTLSLLVKQMGGAQISLSKELSKLHEKTLCGSVSEVFAALSADDFAKKGEYVFILLPPPAQKNEAPAAAPLEVRLVEIMVTQRITLKQAQAYLLSADNTLKRPAVYAAALSLKKLLDNTRILHG